MKKKCYVGRLDELNGEITYTHHICFRTAGDPDRYLNRLAKGWYDSSTAVKEDDGYSHRMGEVFITVKSAVEVPEENYSVLKEFITEL